MSSPVLEIDNLSIAFRSERGVVHAVRAVSLSAARNQVVGIVGESGCGKSTLVSSILGLLPPNAIVTSGSIRFEGRELVGLSEDALTSVRGRQIAMVFQDPMTALNPVMSIGAQMIDIQHREARTRREKLDLAAAFLRAVGIPDPVERLELYPHQFSGGMRQRIAIGMALLMQPSVLIADEPTTALDVTLEAQIAQLFRELKREFVGSILFVSHNLGLVAELCDVIAVMYAGEVVESGPVAELFAAPLHPYSRMLLDCDPARISERRLELPTIPGVVVDLLDPPPGCAFAPRCPRAEALCRVDHPALRPIAPGRSARCHFAGEDHAA